MVTTLLDNFGGYKGMNYPYGLTAAGASAWRTWLTTDYNLARIITHFQWMKTLGVKSVRVWIWIDSMIDKTIGSPAWGASGWSPTSNYIAAYKSNWEDFLTNCVIAESMKVMPVLFIPTISPNAYNAPTDFETRLGGDTDCLLPTNTGTALVDATTLNGNIDSGTGAPPPATTTNLPTGFIKSGSGTVTWQVVSAGTPPLGALNEIKIETGAGQTMGVYTALATFDPLAPLGQWRIDVKGEVRIDIAYYNSANTFLAQDILKNYTTYADWTTFAAGCIDANDVASRLPTAVKMRLIVYARANNTSYMGGARFNYGTTTTKLQNYLDLATDWCVTKYGIGTAYGPGIAAWNLMNEQYTAFPGTEVHPFLRLVYDAIKGTSALPVVVDSTSQLAGTVANAWRYQDCCDIAAGHPYSTDGDIDTIENYPAGLGKMIGEFGADIAGNAYLSATLNPPAMQKILAAGYARGALCAMGWAFQDNPSYCTPAMPNRVAPFTEAASGRVMREFSMGNGTRNARGFRGLKNDV